MKITVDEQGKLTSTTDTVQQAAYVVVDLGSFDNNRNQMQAVNDRGQAAAGALNTGTGRIAAFRGERGERPPVGRLGGTFSIARGINNQGGVVGGSTNEGDQSFH